MIVTIAVKIAATGMAAQGGTAEEMVEAVVGGIVNQFL